jgi:hypothetical protein
VGKKQNIRMHNFNMQGFCSFEAMKLVPAAHPCSLSNAWNASLLTARLRLARRIRAVAILREQNWGLSIVAWELVAVLESFSLNDDAGSATTTWHCS